MPDFAAPPVATLVFSSRLKKHRNFFKQCLIWGSVSAASRPSHILLSLNFHGSCLWNGLSECNSRFWLMSPLWSECHAIYRQFLSACGYNAKELHQKKKVVVRKFTRKWIWDHFWTRVSVQGGFVPSLVPSYFYHLLSYQFSTPHYSSYPSSASLPLSSSLQSDLLHERSQQHDLW